jgi:hypothetical protein
MEQRIHIVHDRQHESSRTEIAVRTTEHVSRVIEVIEYVDESD